MGKGKEVVYGGKTWPSLKKLAKVFGVNYNTFLARLRNGVPLAEALDPHYMRAHRLHYNGHQYTAQRLGIVLGLDDTTVQKRIAAGWEPDRLALPNQRRHYVTAWGRTKTLTAWSREKNISYTTLLRRLRTGMTPEVALSMPVDPVSSKNSRARIAK